ncbi:nuclear transport factor 2 family protein [Sorangium sp. So ce1389]|uniref:nuclear transport factor 2 family protein n=1 Tax=Sorangium sp. So ce1389 TaxID=3133336 RepID=UPI003F5D9CE4
MTIQTNKRLVEEFFAKVNKNDLVGAFAMIDDDVAWWSAGGEHLPFSGVKNKSEFIEAMNAVGAIFPRGLKLVPTGLVAEDDRVAVELAGHAVTADGRSYENLYHSVIKFKDGKIVAVKEYHDTLYAKIVLVDGQR